jgi:hypothetical protein
VGVEVERMVAGIKQDSSRDKAGLKQGRNRE